MIRPTLFSHTLYAERLSGDERDSAAQFVDSFVLFYPDENLTLKVPVKREVPVDIFVPVMREVKVDCPVEV